ncbi:MAG: exopolyphosphatase [Coprothermobacterota bacterium]|nr:exopolyphosphatase [Coprothermobacterota bacterium]
MTEKYRLVTRSDMDGLVAAMLLRELEMIDEIKFVHPKDVQDGKIELNERDITTNLPYIPRVHLAFDHHSSEISRLGATPANLIIDPHAPSTAHVLYHYLGGPARFPAISQDILQAVDKADSARFSLEEILHPTDWVLLNFVMDPRTGLGRFKTFRVSNYSLMMDLISFCRDHTIAEILQLPDVRERTELYFQHEERFQEMVKRCAEDHGKLVVLDLRQEETIWAGNRFMVYALFLQCTVSIHIMWGLQKQNTVFAVGKSILNRTSPLDIGAMMLGYGGGGHEAAGTCQIANERAEEVKSELIAKISAVE